MQWKKLNNPVELNNCINQCSTNISLLTRSLKEGGLNVGGKRLLESGIEKIQGYRVMMKAMNHQGCGAATKNLRSNRISWQNINSSFQGRIQTGAIVNLKHTDPLTFLEDAQYLFTVKIKKLLKIYPMLKLNTDFCCEFTKITSDETDLKYFNSPNAMVDQVTDFKEWWLHNVQTIILNKMDEFQDRDSGWTLSAIVNLTININNYSPLIKSSYIPLPDDIERKKACINVKNNDDACFAWAVTSCLHEVGPNDHPQRTSSYPHYSEVFNLDGINFPMTLNQIKKFEKLNDLSINVYVLEKIKKRHRVQPILLTKTKKDQHVNLLMIQNTYDEDDEDTIKFHFIWIKNLSRLIRTQTTDHKSKIYICDRCLHYFYSEEKLRRHEIDCGEINKCRIIMPQQGEVVKFQNFKNQEKVPFVIYMDTQSILKPIDNKYGKNSTMYQEHRSHSVGYYFKCDYNQELSYYRSYRGKDCAKWFAKELRQIIEDVELVYWAMQPMQLTIQEERKFQSATKCYICSKQFTKNDWKVKNHNHLTGDYRGPAHNSCNLKYKDCKTIPVICHNPSGHDAHFLIKNIAQEFEGRVFVLPVSKEKYISFTKSVKGSEVKFKFIDSFRFMSQGLEGLVTYLDNFKITGIEYPNKTKFNLLKRKGVFPYAYVKSLKNLDETSLPAQSKFYDTLREEFISDEDYNHAQNIWNVFDIKTLGEYSDLYLKTDVLLLADVFEYFRETCYKVYGLDATHYVSAPDLTWDAMLIYTGIELDLISDIDMLIFIERGIRGGISQCSNRFARANNKYMPDFDSQAETSYLQYLTFNSLYGYAMSQALPSGCFKWSSNIDINHIISDNGKIGYILEVDLEYPKDLHDLHNDLPFCPQKLSPPGSNQTKLLTTLYDKERYVIHYRALKQAFKHGLKIKKIHRILQFKQSAWLKPYIDLNNTSMRTNACNNFEKNIYELMNNAIFGKTMEDVRERKIVKLVSNWNGRYSSKVLIAKPNFHSRTILDENLVIIEMDALEIKMNKPVCVGMSVLDISKTSLYSFHYDFMVNIGYVSKIMYCDTDSLIYHVKCPDFYSVMKDNINLFEISDYPPNNFYGIPLANEKVPGLIKDAMNGKVMSDFVGLRSKMYSVRVEGKDRRKKTSKKAQGIIGYVVKKNVSFNDFPNCVRSYYNHNVYTTKQTKIASSANDDKRRLLPYSYNTMAWGHWRIMNM